MELWNGILHERREAFLAACSPECSIEENLPRNVSTFVVAWEKPPGFAEDLPSLAETFRHALLTQVTGFAITHLKLRYNAGKHSEGGSRYVLHKYARLDGIIESVTDIIQALRRIIFRLEGLDMIEAEYIFSIEPKPETRFIATAETFQKPEHGIKVINRNLVVFRCQRLPFKHDIEMTLRMERGVGYRAATEHIAWDQDSRKQSADILLLALDADFNPVKQAGFRIDGGGNNKLSLYFNIETKGNVTPLEAYRQAWEYLSKL